MGGWGQSVEGRFSFDVCLTAADCPQNIGRPTRSCLDHHFASVHSGVATRSTEQWVHLRTTNPIEPTFATIRLRHKRTKGSGTRQARIFNHSIMPCSSLIGRRHDLFVQTRSGQREEMETPVRRQTNHPRHRKTFLSSWNPKARIRRLIQFHKTQQLTVSPSSSDQKLRIFVCL